MTHRMFHVGFMFPGVPKVLDLEQDFSALGDWIRYSQTGWLLWSDRSSVNIMRALSIAVDEDDMIVVTPVEEGGFSGQIKGWMWEWVKSKLQGVETLHDNPKLFDGFPALTRPKV